MIRLGLSIALGLACGGAFLLLTRPSVAYIAAAALIASVLAYVFGEAFGSYNASSRAANAARSNDPAGRRDHARG